MKHGSPVQSELDTLLDEIAVVDGLDPPSAEFDSLLDEIAVEGFYPSTDGEHLPTPKGGTPSVLEKTGMSLVAKKLNFR